MRSLLFGFHDAIYRPGYSKNEEKSNQYMLALLGGLGIDDTIVSRASDIILDTQLHLHPTVPESSELVMDIDMSGFAMGVKNFRIQNECISKEFLPKNPTDDDMEPFLKGRLYFLETLAEKDKIYRTPFFKDKFEAIAQQKSQQSYQRNQETFRLS